MTVKELFMHFSIPAKSKIRCDNAIQIYDRQTTENNIELIPITSFQHGKMTLPNIIDKYAERKVFEWCVKAESSNCFSFTIIVE